MALSRKRKRNCDNYDRFQHLKLEDVMCPVCMSILIEPVSLPCNKHILCYYCFEKTIENNALACPICRKRIGSWVRSACKSLSLVNMKLWQRIQREFPEQIRCKIQGEDDGVADEVINSTRVTKQISTPGEIKQEFEEQLRLYSDEISRDKQLEEAASTEFINKLLETDIENNRLNMQLFKRISYAESDDARIMQLTCDSTMAEGKKTTDNKVTKLENSTKSKQQKACCKSATIDRYFGGRNNRDRISSSQRNSSYCTTSSTRASSSNSIDAEFHHFKPIIREPKTPPKRMPDGSILESSPRRIRPINLEYTRKLNVPKPNLIGCNSMISLSSPKAFSPVKSNIPSTIVKPTGNDDESETDFEDNEEAVTSTTQHSALVSNSNSASTQSSVNCDKSLELYRFLEEELRLRVQQEEKDRKFAEYLQSIWDDENKQKSRSDYELRSKPCNQRGSSSVSRQTTLDKHVQPLSML